MSPPYGILRCLIGVGVLLMTLRSEAAAAAMTNSPAWRLFNSARPLVIGHRGYPTVAPENTLPSFQRAIAAGADLVELDYHHSQEGALVVLHDATLDRTTDATNRWEGRGIKVADRTLAELRELQAGQWFHPAFPATTLPTLGEALEVIQEGSVTLIERKAGDAEACVKLLRERHLINRVVVQAFDWDYLRDFHAREPEQVLGALGPPSLLHGRSLTNAEKALSVAWLNEIKATGAGVAVWNRQVDAAAVSAAHQRGLKVWVYTINEEGVARALLRMGVDGIITDNPPVVWKALALSARPALEVTNASPSRWWKGNLHTHTLWSDGDDYPEMVAAWYKDQGYHFLALSDHNTMLAGERWLNLTTRRGGGATLEKYFNRFGPDGVERRNLDGTNQVRLQPLAAFRSRLEEPDRFLLIPAMEITDRHRTAPVHLNATNLREAIPAQSGSNVLEVIQRNVNAVLRQRARTGQPMFPHLNHPNFGWGITAEELMEVEGERFFEVYNGHPSVHNEGDKTHASTERVWDLVLAWRSGVLKLPLMYGLGVDDSHQYHAWDTTNSNPGRGWVMVRAEALTPAALVQALEDGDFYASSGVVLKDIQYSATAMRVEIAAEPGVNYRTQFIGTRRDFNRDRQPVRTTSGEALRVTQRYSEEIGQVFAEVTGAEASYTFRGDELYVRAKVISSKPKANPYLAGETEAAWLQPVAP